MSKSAQTRLDDSLGYIRDRIDADLAHQIGTLIGGKALDISKELNLGTRWDIFASAATQNAHTQQRHALRALLLCQRVYYSTLWPSLFNTVATRIAHDWLPPDWKDLSCRHWANRSEAEICEGLRTFVATAHNPTYAANAALGWRPCTPGFPPYLTATRANFGGERLTSTCYDAVMLWLFKSGLVSLRWLLKHRGANTLETLTEAFGQGTTIWQGPFSAQNSLPAVPRGYVVHIFENTTPGAWRGHWMISLGNGRAAGVNNNNEAPPVPRDFCTALTLDKQFLDFGKGFAVAIDPSSIPGRH